MIRMATITLFSHEFPPIILSGVGNTARFLSEGLVNSGFKVNAVTLRFGKYNGLKATERVNGVNVHRIKLPLYERIVFSAYSGMFSWMNPGLTTDTDLIHALDSRDAPFIFKGKPMMVNVNDFVLAKTPLNPFVVPYKAYDRRRRYAYTCIARSIERIALRRADVIVPNSQFTRRSIIERYKLNPEKVSLVRKGIDTGEFDALREKKEDMILLVGGNLQMKGGEDVMRAMKMVAGKFPKARLVLIGRGDPINVSFLKRLAVKLGVGKNVEFISHLSHDELLRYYARSRLFILPSYMDSLPQVILEAMAARLPVISSPYGGIPEAVDDGKTGMLVKLGAVGELGDKMIHILENPGLAKEMGEKGREKVGREYDFRRMVKDYIRIYDRLIGVRA